MTAALHHHFNTVLLHSLQQKVTDCQRAVTSTTEHGKQADVTAWTVTYKNTVV